MGSKLAKLTGKKWFGSISSSLIAIVLGLGVGLLLMEVFRPGMGLKAFGIMLQGGLSSGRKGIGNILYYMMPTIFAGLSVAFSNKTGVFNMGVSGQFMIGAMVSIMIGGKLSLPPAIHWLVCILAAGIAGVVWSIVPALLKAFYDVNEIITTIMTNYIAMYLVNEMITKNWYNQPQGRSKAVQTSALMPRIGLDKLFPETNIHLGIVLAFVFAIIVFVLLFKTSFGFGVRAVGLNRDAGKYMGINEKANIIISMLISGFLAGFGGGVQFLSSLTKCYEVAEVLAPDAIYAIPASLLGSAHPFGVIAAAGFISYLTCGGLYIQGLGYPPETVDMITSVIIYFSAFSMAIKILIDRYTLNQTSRISTDRKKKPEKPARAGKTKTEVKQT